MTEAKPLNMAKEGVRHRIILCRGTRLRELGFTENSVVIPLNSAPLGGDPRAYWLRGCVMALRHEDAALVRVCVEEETE